MIAQETRQRRRLKGTGKERMTEKGFVALQ
jgi:hypothetical protein